MGGETDDPEKERIEGENLKRGGLQQDKVVHGENYLEKGNVLTTAIRGSGKE